MQKVWFGHITVLNLKYLFPWVVFKEYQSMTINYQLVPKGKYGPLTPTPCCIIPSNWKLSEFRPRPRTNFSSKPIYIYIYIYVCINFREGPLINIKFYCDHFINLRSKIPCWKIVEENFLSKDIIMNKRAYTCILIRRSPLGL